MQLTKENLSYMYLVKNKSRKELSDIFLVPEWKIKKLLEKYKIKKPNFQYHELLNNREWLFEQYITNNRTIDDIAKELNHKNDVVSSRLKKFNINKLRVSNEKLLDKEWLKNQLYDNDMDSIQLAKMLGISTTTLIKYKKRYKIRRKDIQRESFDKLNNKEWLENERKTKTQTQISEEINISPGVISKKCIELNVESTPEYYSSSHENEIEQFLIDNNIQYEKRTKKIIYPKEIDFYIPEHDFAIEYNGLFWHSHENKKDKKYHQNKTIECHNKNIKLLHIWEHEFINPTKKKILLNKILYHTKKLNTIKIRASKCIIKEISQSEYNCFLEKNHIQGKCISTFRYGLFFGNDLVCCIGLGISRFNKNYDLELHRMCSSDEYTIYGGIEKLWAYVKENHSNSSIISYCNMHYASIGNTYEKILGMKRLKITAPNYFYHKQHHDSNYYKYNFKILTRYQAQKHKLKNILDVYDPNITEYQNMQLNGYRVCYDSGNLVFVT